MSNVKLILDNTADAAVLTASPPVVPELPVSLLQDDRRGRAMRSTSTEQNIYGNYDEVITADGCTLVRHNLTDLATIQLRLYDGPNQTGNVVYDSGVLVYGDLIPAGEFSAGIDPFGGAFHTPPLAIMWFEPTAYRSFSISLSDPANPSGYLQAGRLIIGLSFSPENNFSWGCDLEFVDNSDRQRTAAGGLRTRKQERYRRLSISLDWITDAERDSLSSEFRAANGRDVLVSAFPDKTGIRLSDYTLVSQIVGGTKFVNNRKNNYRMSLVFEDV
jgi:hypothetical protein